MSNYDDCLNSSSSSAAEAVVQSSPSMLLPPPAPPTPPPPATLSSVLPATRQQLRSSSDQRTVSFVQSELIPPWFNDLIEHGFDGLLSIVTKNLAEEVDEDGKGEKDVVAATGDEKRGASSLDGDQEPQHRGQQSHLIDTSQKTADDNAGRQQQKLDAGDKDDQERNEKEERNEQKIVAGASAVGGNAIRHLPATNVVPNDNSFNESVGIVTTTTTADRHSSESNSSRRLDKQSPTDKVFVGGDKKAATVGEEAKVASLMAPSVNYLHRHHHGGTTRSEEPRPGFVKLATSQFEKNITVRSADNRTRVSLSTPPPMITFASSAPAALSVEDGGDNYADGDNSASAEDLPYDIKSARLVPSPPPPPPSPLPAYDPVTRQRQLFHHSSSVIEPEATDVNGHQPFSAFTEACIEEEAQKSDGQRQSEQVAAGSDRGSSAAEEVVKRDAVASSTSVLGNGSGGGNEKYYGEGKLLPASSSNGSTCERSAEEGDRARSSKEVEYGLLQQTTATTAQQQEEEEEEEADGQQTQWTLSGELVPQVAAQTSVSAAAVFPLSPPPPAADVCSSEGAGHNKHGSSRSTTTTTTTERQTSQTFAAVNFGNCNRNSDWSVLLSCSATAVTACCTSSLLLQGAATCEHSSDRDTDRRLVINAGDSSPSSEQHQQIQQPTTTSEASSDDHLINSVRVSSLPSSSTVSDFTGGDQGRGVKVISNDLRQSPPASVSPAVINGSHSKDSGVSHCHHSRSQSPSQSASVSRTNAVDCTTFSKFNDQTGGDDQLLPEPSVHACGHRPQQVVQLVSSPLTSSSSNSISTSSSLHASSSFSPPPTRTPPSSVSAVASPTPSALASHQSPFSADSNNSASSPFFNLSTTTDHLPPQSSPISPTSGVFGQIKRLKHLPRLRSSIVEFERQSSLTASVVCSSSTLSSPSVIVDDGFTSAPSSSSPAQTSLSADGTVTTATSTSSERFIVQLKSVLCTECLLHRQTSWQLPEQQEEHHCTSGDVSSAKTSSEVAASTELYLIKLNLFRRGHSSSRSSLLCSSGTVSPSPTSSVSASFSRNSPFQEPTKSCPVTGVPADTDLDVQFSLDQLFEQLSIVPQSSSFSSAFSATASSSLSAEKEENKTDHRISCSNCDRVLHFSAAAADSRYRYRPVLYNFRESHIGEQKSFAAQGALVSGANVLVNLCAARHSHDLTFAFAPVKVDIATDLSTEAKNPEQIMVEEGTTSVGSTAVATAPNRLILLRPHSMGCRYYHHHHSHHLPHHISAVHQKRPSSVNSSSSGSDHTKDSDVDCGGLASDNSAEMNEQGGGGSNSSSDCEYGPGFVGRLCNKFMTMYGQEPVQGVPPLPTSPSAVNGTNGLIKRASSMEELTYRSRNGLSTENGKPAAPAAAPISTNGAQHTNSHSSITSTTTTNHHQQVNGTKKRLLWSSMTNGHNTLTAATNGHGSRGGYLKNGYSQNNKVATIKNNDSSQLTSNGAVTTNGSAAVGPVSPSPSSASPSPITTTTPPLYPSNIVKNIVKSHQSSAAAAKSTSAPINLSTVVSSNGATTTVASSSAVGVTSGVKSGAAGAGNGGTVRHYPSPITHNYVRSNLLLTAPLPYIRKAKSVEALSLAPFSVSASAEEEGPENNDNVKAAKMINGSDATVDIGKTGNKLPKGGSNQPPVSSSLNDEPLCYHEQQQQKLLPPAQSPALPVRSNEHDCTTTVMAADQQQQQQSIVCSTGASSTTIADHSLSSSADETTVDATAKVADEKKEEEEEEEEVEEMSGRLASVIHDGSEEAAEEPAEAAAHNLDVQFATATNIGSSSSLLNDSGICETLRSSSSGNSMMMSGDNSVPLLSPSPQPASSSVSSLVSQRRLPTISDSEMPKPDIVKTYKRLFESPNDGTGVVSPTPTTPTTSLPPVKSSPSDNSSEIEVATSAKHPKKAGDEAPVIKATKNTPPAIPSRVAASGKLPSKSATVVSSSPSKPAIPPRRTPVTTITTTNNNYHPHHKAPAPQPPVPSPPFSRSTQTDAPSSTTKTELRCKVRGGHPSSGPAKVVGMSAAPATVSKIGRQLPAVPSSQPKQALPPVPPTPAVALPSSLANSSRSTSVSASAKSTVAGASSASATSKVGTPSSEGKKLLTSVPSANNNTQSAANSSSAATASTLASKAASSSTSAVKSTTTTQPLKEQSSQAVNATDKVFPPTTATTVNGSRPAATASTSTAQPTSAPQQQHLNHAATAPEVTAPDYSSGKEPTTTISLAAVSTTTSPSTPPPPPANSVLLDAAKKLKPVGTIKPIPQKVNGNTASTSTAPANRQSTATSTPKPSSPGGAVVKNGEVKSPTPSPTPANTSDNSSKPMSSSLSSAAVQRPSPPKVAMSSGGGGSSTTTTVDASTLRPTTPSSSSSSPPSSLSSSSSTSSTAAPVTLKPSLLKSTSQSNNSSTTPTKSTLWSKSSAPATGASSVVFDFRDKSVKPNIALQPAPFGSKPIQKRVWQEINGGDGTDYEYDDSAGGAGGEDDANYCGSMEVPAPSGIIFEGENVVVAGRSCLMIRRNKNLSLQFNDSAISTTYEYPMDSFGSYDEPPPLPSSETSNGKLNSSNSTSSLQNKFLTGTSNLASYKPAQMANSGVDFQLGITKSAVPETAGVSAGSSSSGETLESLPDSVNNHIVPAGQADTVSFSKSSTASDLLF